MTRTQTMVRILGTSALAIGLLAGTAAAQDGEAEEEVVWTTAEAFYLDNCIRCHGEDGQAGTRMAERYEVEPFTTAEFDELGRDGIRDAMVNGSENMDPVEGIGDAEMDALVDYVLTLAQ